MNGNSGSGAAVAEEVKVIAPTVNAPSVAATSLAFSLAELNIVVPCCFVFVCAVRASPRRVVGQSYTGEPFRDICTKSPKWFRRFNGLFLGCARRRNIRRSSQALRGGVTAPENQRRLFGGFLPFGGA
jgi:hypothetical protein